MSNLQQKAVKICVYKITNPNNRIYIGSTVNYKKRILAYQRLACKKQTRLFNSFIKHGVDNHRFEILCECDLSDLRQKEGYYGQLYDCLSENGLNCFLPKHGEKFVSARRRKFTLETRLKMSKSQMGKPVSEESRKKISAFHKGRPRSKEYREKLRQANLGKKLSEETRKKLSVLNKGKKWSASTMILVKSKRIARIKHNRSTAAKAWVRSPHSLKTKLQMSESALGGKNHKSKLLLNTQTGIYYDCVKDAANSYNMHYDYFRSKMLNLRNKNNTPFIYV